MRRVERGRLTQDIDFFLALSPHSAILVGQWVDINLMSGRRYPHKHRYALMTSSSIQVLVSSRSACSLLKGIFMIVLGNFGEFMKVVSHWNPPSPRLPVATIVVSSRWYSGQKDGIEDWTIVVNVSPLSLTTQ